jgi:hypothetical protein
VAVERVVPRPPIPAPPIPISLSLPLDPEFLNRQLQAVSHRLGGMLMIPTFRLVFLVPAGATVEVPFPLPPKHVCTRRAPLRFEGSYYHKDITIDVKCDRRIVNPYPMPLTGPFEVDFGMYYVKRERVDITIRNGTTVDAEVTFQVMPHIMHVDLYESWYRPLTELAYEILDWIAKTRPRSL